MKKEKKEKKEEKKEKNETTCAERMEDSEEKTSLKNRTASVRG